MIWTSFKPRSLFPELMLPGQKVFLRPPALEDYFEWSEIRGRCADYLQPYEPLWASASLSRSGYSSRLQRQSLEWLGGQSRSFLIFKAQDVRLVGGMNINNICRGAAQYASLGYWIDEAQQGQGYMSEAVKLAVRYCFDDLGLHRVQAATLAHNERSRKLLLHNGFQEEGFAEKYLQINGLWQDHVLFGLPLERWQGLHSSQKA